MTYVPRNIEKKLVEILCGSSAPHTVLLIAGARQVGKSTCIQQVLSSLSSDYVTFNFETDLSLLSKVDRARDFEAFEQVLRLNSRFNPDLEQILFIDEAQESEQLGRFVRSMKEKWLKTRTILSGSSMKRLFRDNQRIPVGRIRTVLVQPFSFAEFLFARDETYLEQQLSEFDPCRPPSQQIHEKALSLLDSYFEVGGLPEVVQAYVMRTDYRAQREAIFLEQRKDFIRVEPVSNIHMFDDALRGVANHIGNVSKFTHISDNQRRAKQLISLLEEWGLVYTVEQRGLNPTQSLSPKRYLYDIGIAQDLRNMPFPALSFLRTKDPALRTPLGGLIENFVICSLIESDSGPIRVSSWAKNARSSMEVDFVWRARGGTVPIECKATLKPSLRSFTSVIEYLNLTGGKLGLLTSPAQYCEWQYQGKILSLIHI